MSNVLDLPLSRARLSQGSAPVAFQPSQPSRPNLPSPQAQPSKPWSPAEPFPRPRVEYPRVDSAGVRHRQRERTKLFVVPKALLFLAVFAMTYVSSTLGGHYLVEKTRNQANDASFRAAAAQQAEQEVQRQLDVLTSQSSIDTWAKAHSFWRPDAPSESSPLQTASYKSNKENTIVASNR